MVGRSLAEVEAMPVNELDAFYSIDCTDSLLI